jgi:hypothetical protein
MASDPDSADEDFSFGAEPPDDQPPSSVDEPFDYAALDRSSRFALALLAAWASPFLVDGIGSLLAKNLGGDSFVLVFMIGVFLAKFGLLSIWLAWGGSRFIWRMLVVMVSVLFTTLAVSAGSDGPQMFLAVFLITLLCSGAIAVPRLFGVHWVAEWTLHREELFPARRNQFSIFDLLVWTTVVAIIAGVMSAIRLRMNVFEFGGICLIAVPIAALIILLAMWTELNKAESIAGFVILNYFLLVVLAVVLGSITRAPGEAFVYFLGTLAIALTCVLCALYFFRRAGDRLVRARGSADTTHPATDSEFEDGPSEWS